MHGPGKVVKNPRRVLELGSVIPLPKVYFETDVDAMFLQVAVLCICLFVILPLTLVGTVLGRNLAGQPNYPCRVNAVPRPIPEKKWFMEPAVIIMLGGILPFGSIFIEMYVLIVHIDSVHFVLLLSQLLLLSRFTGTSYSLHSGHTRSTMFTDSCF